MLNFQPTIQLGKLDSRFSQADEDNHNKQYWLSRKDSSIFKKCSCGAIVNAELTDKPCPVCGCNVAVSTITYACYGLDNMRSRILASRQEYMIAA